jgi:hypothetical protein
MTDSANTRTLSRRSALIASAGIAAMLGGAGGTALAGSPDGEDDAELFVLWEEYLKLDTESNDAFDARDYVASDVRKELPPTPDCVDNGWVQIVLDGRIINTDLAAFCLSERQTLSEVLITATKLKPRSKSATKLITETEAWVKGCEAVSARFGVPAMCDAYEASRRARDAAFARFLATPAKTLVGMAFKTSAMLYFDYEAQYAWKGSVGDRQHLSKSSRSCWD